MAKLPEDFISQLKQANSIVDLFRAYAELKKQGRNYVCCCPFHAEKTPSCTIYPEGDPHFYCFGCGESGDVITFLMKMDDLSYMDAVRTLAQRSGMTVPVQNQPAQKPTIQRDRCYEINRDTANFYYQMLLRGNNKTGLQYLSAHQIRPQTVKKYGLGFAPNEWHQLRDYLKQKGYSESELVFAGVCRRNSNGNVYDYFQNRIIFPVMDLRGNITGFAGMAIDAQNILWIISPENPVFSRKKSLFSLNFAKHASSDVMILANDPFNAVAMYQAGFENVIAPMEPIITLQSAKLISQHVNEVIITFPVNQTVLNNFSELNLSVKILHSEYMQTPEAYLQQYGAEQFRNLIDNAGDANLVQLEQCQTGLNPESQEDKNTILQRSIQVLSGIKNPLEREIYLVNTAKKLNMNPDNLRIQINQNFKKRSKSQMTRTRSLKKEELQASFPCNRKKYLEEKQMLAFLLCSPEHIPAIQKKLSPENFITDMHRNIYLALCQNCQEMLTPEEKKYIAEIRTEYYKFEMNQEEVTKCIAILKTPEHKFIG